MANLAQLKNIRERIESQFPEITANQIKTITMFARYVGRYGRNNPALINLIPQFFEGARAVTRQREWRGKTYPSIVILKKEAESVDSEPDEE